VAFHRLTLFFTESLTRCYFSKKKKNTHSRYCIICCWQMDVEIWFRGWLFGKKSLSLGKRSWSFIDSM